MAVQRSTIAVPTEVAQSSALTVKAEGTVTVYVDANPGSTIQVQVSPDGTAWVNEGSPFVNAEGYREVTVQRTSVRLDVTAYTSGTPTCEVLHPK